MSKIRVLVVPSDRTGVGQFRSINPHLALERNYPEEFKVDIDYTPKIDDDDFLKKYDIIHFHRTLGDYEKMPQTIQRIKDLGIIGIMDLDDHWAPGKHHPAYQIIKQHKLDEKIKGNLKLAEYITTTTPAFVDEIKRVTGNQNVFVMPNAINPNEKQFTPKPEPSDKIRIGWLGGSSHHDDLKLLEGIVDKLHSDKLLDKVQMVLCGFDLRGTITQINQETGEQTQRKILPKESVWYKYEQIFTKDYTYVSDKYKKHLNAFTKEGADEFLDESYRRVWTKPITSYASNYNLFDISLAPLVENKFNEVKSQLKVIEAGFHKKALIAQDFGPYQFDTIPLIEKGGKINEKGNAIMVETRKNHKDWYKGIKKLIENPELIELAGNNLYNTVNGTYDIDSASEARKDLYKKLVKEGAYEVA
jgi:glycosyltransferase involved in cell wall biosynthesis